MIRVVMIVIFSLIIAGCGENAKPLVVGFWNVENLFDLVDDPDKNDDEFASGGRKGVTKKILDLKLDHLAEMLTDINADVLGLAEIENRKVLEMLDSAYTGRDYQIVHFESPDERGIDCALLYDPQRFRLTESQPIKVEIGNPTRDILYVKGKYRRKDLHIFVNHWPSHWGGTEKTFPLRVKTAAILRKQVNTILEKDPGAEVIIMGDLNDEPGDPSVAFHLGATMDRKKIAVKPDDADCSPEKRQGCGGCPGMGAGADQRILLWNLMGPYEGRINGTTYKYRGKDKNIDQIIVSPGLMDSQGLGLVENSLLIVDGEQYRQQEGNYQGYPFRFWAGDRLLGGYSDHLPVKVAISR